MANLDPHAQQGGVRSMQQILVTEASILTRTHNTLFEVLHKFVSLYAHYSNETPIPIPGHPPAMPIH